MPGMYQVCDASRPPAELPKGYSVIAGYIGGPTPYVWTREDWARFGKVRKLPILVASIAAGGKPQPVGEAFGALRTLYDLGVPQGSPLVLDMEEAVNRSYVNTINRVMRWGGYRVWVYGSADTVFGNPPCSGYWVADYAGRGPFMFQHSYVRATQYANAPAYDSSVIKWWQYQFRVKVW